MEIRGQWIDQKFAMQPQDATYNTYKRRTGEMLQETISQETVVLSYEKLSLGGNIDAAIVRNFCHGHGCKLKVHRRTRGGVELGTVKARRNGLAHGDTSFAECGRDYAAADIARISQECFTFLAGFVRSVEKFIISKGYKI